MIDAYCTHPHYLAHTAPIWRALPEGRRGRVYVELNRNELLPAARALGLHETDLVGGRPDYSPDPVLIAGGSDLVAGWQGRPVVFVEHGAGQTYAQCHDVGYAGGIGRNAVRLFLAPNLHVARANLAAYPDADAEIIGDPTLPDFATLRDRQPDDVAVIAFSFHWPCPINPETSWTFPHWRPAIEDLLRTWSSWQNRTVLGHAHPRAADRLRPYWESVGVPYVAYWPYVRDQADVYVVDNSSTGAEFMACDRPVVWLSAPQYRRDVEHGGRFWDWVGGGVHVTEPGDLRAGIEAALTDADSSIRAERRRLGHLLYPFRGTEAAQRAADAILERWPGS